ncbi:MAG: TetR/AcrR family transcriptional regulator [Acetatifactor sp.]|nr:TetR/AcrR family transcriptional regulator [Acetatifactor sp.]MDE7351829.1 TetR/AcrR family transcriptional regulator [Acetatifactor sp.]
MPPKAKFTKDEIIEAAVGIVREEGFPALTARVLGARLGSSARPVFTVFQGMEEVQQAVIRRAKEIYGEYVEEGLSDDIPFRGVGTQYILFSIREPKLFQLLFMKEQKDMPELSGVLPLIDDNYEKILLSIEQSYGLKGSSAERLYRHMWIYSHGIAALCATGMCRFTGEEIKGMLAEASKGILKNMKGEGL